MIFTVLKEIINFEKQNERILTNLKQRRNNIFVGSVIFHRCIAAICAPSTPKSSSSKYSITLFILLASFAEGIIAKLALLTLLFYLYYCFAKATVKIFFWVTILQILSRKTSLVENSSAKT